ncbi:MAG: M48 family metalloprotease [Deltaproteobacteria bacterium]|nr:M48 family metalloprotease [Deltaproteobacteria bacterium]
MEFYPPGPTGVPANLTATTLRYRLHAALVLLGLLTFAGLYLGSGIAALSLILWLFISGPGPSDFGWLVWMLEVLTVCIVTAFFFKAIFRRAPSQASTYDELLREQEPTLFEFIDRVCTDTGAPHPKHVYVSPDVNAAVFWDSSVSSLFWPVQKNLVIGLGLVNALTLDEFKAVLAHEFGHITQRSMRVGSYIRVVSVVMEDMIYGRDAWDDLLRAWCRMPIRIAVFAWGLTLALWIFRRLLALAYAGIHALNAALKRQMEFHADSVAVSVSGSDSLVRALHRLVFADRALSFATEQVGHAADRGLRTDNLFLHQLAAEDRLRETARDPSLGVPPDLPAEPTQALRVFDGGAFDRSPDMWASHPPNHVRELSAQRVYLRSVLDTRSAWSLFASPETLQRKGTAALYATGSSEKLTPAADVQAFLDREHAATQVDPRWRGAYEHRQPAFSDLASDLASPIVLDADPRAALEHALGPDLDALVSAFNTCYGESSLLQKVKEDGDVRRFSFRGRRYDARQLGGLLEQVNVESRRLMAAWEVFDVTMLHVHRALAHAQSEAAEAALVARYLFLHELLRLSADVASAKAQVESGLSSLLRGGRDHAYATVGSGWILLDSVLTRSHELMTLKLPNVPEGVPVADCLGPRRLPPGGLIEYRNLDAEWFGAFLSEADDIAYELDTLERMCWASIVRLHERIGDAG